MSHDHSADSSGVPWEGREFQPNAHAGDDGTTPEAVAAAILAFRDGTGSLTELARALAESRALIPLMTHAGDDFDADNPVMEDKVQELAVVTLAGPNGETVYPAFTSVEAMRAWNRDARPIPIEMRRVCLATAGEGAERVVVNPGTDQIVLRRPVVWAIAQGHPVVMAWESADLLAKLHEALDGVNEILEVALAAGDPTATGVGAELAIVVTLPPGLDQTALSAVLSDIQHRISLVDVLVTAADSVAIKLTSG